MNEMTFKISGFHCESCVKVATMKIKKIHCVEEVSVTLDGEAHVRAKREIPLDEFAEALKETGYVVTT